MKVWTLSKLGLPYVPSTLVGVATFVQGTVVQGDFGPMRLLSKEAFTSDKLAQIFFFILYSI